MAGGGAFVILLDEIATMVKVAAEPTAKIADTGPAKARQPDDNDASASQKRDLSIIFDVLKGSLRNKAILVPSALALNFLAPWAVLPMLAAGGAFFAVEGIKKVKALVRGEERSQAPVARPGESPDETRARKVKAAVRTDLVLSGEITAVTLAVVAAMPFAAQAAIMGGVALGATLGVYTIIAGIIKMEDVGAWLADREGERTAAKAARTLGRAILAGKPHVLKGISTAGTVAIFMVGGGLIFHGIPAAGHFINDAISGVVSSPYMHSLVKLGASFLMGVSTGLAVTPVEHIASKPLKRAYKSVKSALKDFFVIPRAPGPAPAEPSPQISVEPPVAEGKPALSGAEAREKFDAAAKPVLDMQQFPLLEVGQGFLSSAFGAGLRKRDNDILTKDAPPKSHDSPIP